MSALTVGFGHAPLPVVKGCDTSRQNLVFMIKMNLVASEPWMKLVDFKFAMAGQCAMCFVTKR